MLDTELKKAATQWAKEITTEAKKNLGKFGNLIGVRSSTEVRDGIVSILTTAYDKTRNQWGVVRVARAYEKGSGIHGSKKSTYVIRPRLKQVLAFFWDKVDEETPRGKKFRGISEKTGKAIFRYVDHPGVEALHNGRGYMKPAIDKVRRQVRRETPEIVRKEVKLSIRRAFSNAK